MFDLTCTSEDKGAPTPLTLPIDQAVIAGWTGRDPVARDKHIAELEAIGIARPATSVAVPFSFGEGRAPHPAFAVTALSTAMSRASVAWRLSFRASSTRRCAKPRWLI